ncbi:MAG: short-chain dehydrogenase [Blastococcus sp.]|jgi:NAD(P)-dependent dehydrogenase (short-subunit alcohol dehydrogenase family)|nr:short-chain dehydrogenase [Blastococcus sp.]
MRVPDADRRNLLEGKVALVTGGGGSLGLATAKLFLKEGARVVLADRNADALKTAQASLDDVNVSTVAGDATVEADVAAAMDTVIDRHGRLDVIVANAGTPASAAPITEFDTDEFDRTLAVHVRGVFLACKHGLRVLSDGGSVVIVSSVAGLRADPGVSAYVAAKHAQVGLMRSVAKEAAPRRIRVNTIHPGPVANEFQAGIEERLTPVLGTDATAFFDQQIPLGRHARPEEIAKSVLYLASDQSSFTTGSTLVVDGGMSA